MRQATLVTLTFGYLMAVFCGFCQATTWLVNRSADDTNPGSLRAAIISANGGSTGDTIEIQATLPAPITITTLLPILTQNQVTINGNGNTLTSNPARDLLFLNGNSCTVQGLALVNSHNAIIIGNGYNNLVRNCRIGTDWKDAPGLGNLTGITLGGSNNIIGGATADANVISGNTTNVYALGSGHLLRGNYLGTSSSGFGPIANPNMYRNVFWSVSDGLIRDNMISSVASVDNLVLQESSGNSVCGNIIGLNKVQHALIGGRVGIVLTNAANHNFIGLPQTGMGNVIAGNSDIGIWIGTSDPNKPSDFNVIQNNFIGMSMGGLGFPNLTGVHLDHANYNLIGGNRASLESNVISGNTYSGVEILTGTGNSICGNYIGTDLSGANPYRNGTGSILVADPGNILGGPNTDPGHLYGNVISGILLAGADQLQILGNYFGLSANGQNQLDTVTNLEISGNHCLVGGNLVSAANVFAGASPAISVSGSGNTIAGNKIGILANGAKPPVTLQTGITLAGNWYGNCIGMKDSGPGNLIAYVQQGINQAGTSRGNGFFANTICAFSNPATGVGMIASGTTALKTAPVITNANIGGISGSAVFQDYVEVFQADRANGLAGGSLRLLGRTTTDAGGGWSISGIGLGLANGDYICATAWDSLNGSSGFSQNYCFGSAPTSTPVVSATPTFTASPSITATPRVSATPTSTATPVVSATPTVTASPSLTATPRVSATPTSTVTPVVSATPTARATSSATITITATALLNNTYREVQAFPNPGKNKIRFLVNVTQPGEVQIDIYNIVGEKVTQLKDRSDTGRRLLVWNCEPAAPGIYIAQVRQDNKKIAVTKVGVVR